MNIEFYHEVISLFNRFIYEADEKMYQSRNRGDDVILQAPQFILDILLQALRATNSINPTCDPNQSSLSSWQGIKVQPTYEMAIIIFHKQYPLYKEEWMLKKIALEPPQTLKKEWYTVTIVKMKEFFGMGGANPADN